MLIPYSIEQVESAIAIIGAEGASEDEIESKVLDLVKDKTLARRLIDCIPEAFGLVYIPNVANVRLQHNFSVPDSHGNLIRFELSAEPIFEAAMEIAKRMLRAGPNATFDNVAFRSSSVSALNNALTSGVSIEGAVISGPAFIGIPAEIYPPEPAPIITPPPFPQAKRESIWKRLFGA